MIVNEFGEHGVDGSLVAPGHEPVELNGGQIFCSCLSPRLLETLVSMRERDLRIVLVEASGLARPAALASLLEQLERLVPGGYRFRGLMVVVDADRFDKLARMAPVVEEQVRHADALLVNKADLVDRERIEEVEAHVRQINPTAPMTRTVRCDVRWEAVPNGAHPDSTRGVDVGGWPMGRPEPLHLEVTVRDREDAARRCRDSAGLALRIKGFARGGAGLLRIDAVGDRVDVEVAELPDGRSGVTVIPATHDCRDRLLAIWQTSPG